MKTIIQSFLGFLLFCILQSCSPQITKTLVKTYPSLSDTTDIQVLKLGEEITFQYEELGTVRVGDNGFGGNCEYDDQIVRAKNEARKIGGNVIKIVEHIPPHSQMMAMRYVYYPCHEILVLVLKRK
jgi:hypothetical protein